jgi:hypothetical protein
MEDQPKTRGHRRWIGAGVAVVVIAVVIFAVAQGSGSSSGSLNAIAKAAEVTQREPGGRAKIHATVIVVGSPERITETGSISFDESGRSSGELTVRSHSTGKEIQMTALADGTKSYVSSPDLESTTEGKKWMEIDYSAALPEGSSTPSAGSPKEGLKILEGVEKAEEVGKEEVDGVLTTHYRGSLPAHEEVFGVKMHVSSQQVDVWIDAQGRVRRIQISITNSIGEAGTTTTTDMTIDYVEFGQVPKIELPKPDEVFDATSRIESQIQSAAEEH